jgi:hypothetical protein
VLLADGLGAMMVDGKRKRSILKGQSWHQGREEGELTY